MRRVINFQFIKNKEWIITYHVTLHAHRMKLMTHHIGIDTNVFICKPGSQAGKLILIMAMQTLVAQQYQSFLDILRKDPVHDREVHHAPCHADLPNR